MDVVHARADLVRVGECTKIIEQLHARARGFDRNDVGIHFGDFGQDVAEFGVAHVRVNLGVVAHGVSGDAKGEHGVVQIALPIAALERQTFAQSGFVNLDDADAGSFEVEHFAAQGEGDLQHDFVTRQVFAHERPLQHGHGAGQHAFDGSLGQALGKMAPRHGHGMRACHVAVNDGRFDAARAVALHPAVLREGVTVQLFTEVFNHVVALGFAVYQNVQAQTLLLVNHTGDFGSHCHFVLMLIDCAFFECGADAADFAGLWERTNRGGWQQRQLETLILRLNTLCERCVAQRIVWLNLCDGSAHIGAIDLAPCAVGLPIRGVLRDDLLRAVISQSHGFFQSHDFIEFLAGECQHAFEFGCECRFVRQVERTVQQRATGADPQIFTALRARCLYHRHRFTQIVRPNIAAVDHAQ